MDAIASCAHRRVFGVQLENTLLDGARPPLVKITDFGLSKSDRLHSKPNTKVGTPAYMCPEMLSGEYDENTREIRKYDGKAADIWSLGVMLYVMLVGRYPFSDPNDPQNPAKQIQLILAARLHIPPDCRLSPEARQLLAAMLEPNPRKRVTTHGIKASAWYQRLLPIKYNFSNLVTSSNDSSITCLQGARAIEEMIDVMKAEQRQQQPSSWLSGVLNL